MHYEIIKESNSLIVYTQEILNFEPKDWRKNLKNDIVLALKEIIPINKYLMAKLQTNEADFFDVENILFYNVGTSNFKKFDTKGVWFILDRSCAHQEFKYIHKYSFVDSIDNSRANIIAEWSNIIIDKPSTSKKPLDYWITLKKSDSIIVYKHNYEKEFGIYIEIYKPQKESINIVNIQKALLDGIISAFHKVSFVDSTILDYLAAYTRTSSEFILKIINNSVSCLPMRNVIQKYRCSIKWNPQDEKCVDTRIVIKDSDDDSYKFSGYIFEK